MKIIDSHIHLHLNEGMNLDEMRRKYLEDIEKAGVFATQIMSPDPKRYDCSAGNRLKTVMDFCADSERLYPFFWLNPMEDDFLEQIDKAVECGIAGFKMICSGFYPNDENVIAACRKIAEYNKPVLFHSGILWDGRDSSRYNRPGEFEALLNVPNLRFCLAHVSWPWTDECIAVYGKFNNAYTRNSAVSCEMFIDITPGTPHVYREEVFKRLFCSDYQVKYNIMFGSDCTPDGYNIRWVKDWLDQDLDLIRRFNPDDADDVIDHIYYRNFLRFIGRSDEKPERTYPEVGK